MSKPTHQQVKQVVSQNSCPFATTQDVAEQFPDVTDKTIRKRLKDLVEQGKLRRRKVGAAANVWYLPAQEMDRASSASPSSVNQ